MMDCDNSTSYTAEYRGYLGVCPKCGFCPTCGRGGFDGYPQYPCWPPVITWTICDDSAISYGGTDCE